MSQDVTNNPVVYLNDYTPVSFLIDDVDLHVDLHEDHTRIVSTLSLRANPAAESCSELFLNGEDLLLEAIECDGAPLSEDAYTVSEHGVLLHDLPSQFQLTTTVVIHPETNTLLMGLYQSSGNFCTQCQHLKLQGEFANIKNSNFGPFLPPICSIFLKEFENGHEK